MHTQNAETQASQKQISVTGAEIKINKFTPTIVESITSKLYKYSIEVMYQKK